MRTMTGYGAGSVRNFVLRQPAKLGVLTLETRIPMIPGDIANPEYFEFPVLHEVVRGASASRVIVEADPSLVESFVEAGRRLVERGAAGLVTSCGFLSLFQREISKALPVPVATSSLLQIPSIQAILPDDQCVGVLTVSADDLTPRHFQSAGCHGSLPVGGVDPLGEFASVFLGNTRRVNWDQAEMDLIDAALALQAGYPNMGAIVLECSSMVPFAPAIQAAVDIPVYSFDTLVRWFYCSLQAKVYTEN